MCTNNISGPAIDLAFLAKYKVQHMQKCEILEHADHLRKKNLVYFTFLKYVF